MGEMADYYGQENPDEIEEFARASERYDLARLQEIWDIAHDVRPGSDKVCSMCKTDGLWKNTDAGWRLHDGRTGTIHQCERRPS